MRIFYTLIWILALPLVLVRLWWRGRSEPGYRLHIRERLGIYPTLSHQRLEHRLKQRHAMIWVHAVSVGETRAAEPLIQRLLVEYPDRTILLTHMTPTGRATGASLFKPGTVLQCYLPYDIPWLIHRFIRHFSPQICLLMETEVWPNLIHTCRDKAVPVILVNARLSARSYKSALRLSGLMQPACAAITCVAAQTEADAQRIRQLGTPMVVVTGNSKFDVQPDPVQQQAGLRLRQQLGSRPVLVCASTREGEEALILQAFIKAKAEFVLLLVPRHPQRFDPVAQLIGTTGLTMVRRSAMGTAPLDAAIQVILGDSMGEMTSYLCSADIAFIGGSLLPLGGQNLIEACAVQKPVLIGPHTYNFASITEEAILANAAKRIQDADDLITQTHDLFIDQVARNNMGQQALAFARQHRGATDRTMALLEKWIT